MRRLVLAASLTFYMSAGSGCVVPIYNSDQGMRTQELIFTSENLRQMIEEWQRIWFLDQPSHLTPFRMHGGLI